MKIKDLRTLNEANATGEAQGYIRNRLQRKEYGGMNYAEAQAEVDKFNSIIDSSDKQLDHTTQMNMAKDFLSRYKVDGQGTQQQTTTGQDNSDKDSQATIVSDDNQEDGYENINYANSEGIYNGDYKDLMFKFNKSKKLKEKDSIVGQALKKAGVGDEVINKLKSTEGLLTDFVRAFKWQEFKKDNVFINALKNFPKYADVDNSKILSDRRYFQAFYNDYTEKDGYDTADLNNRSLYQDSTWEKATNKSSRNVKLSSIMKQFNNLSDKERQEFFAQAFKNVGK